ncbi:hypothetical protein CANINC_002166 [Pichia inconspicua]|uniref:GDP-mannose transporter n=1 Tax=Pichia inconspicua TaxID=52247 RepID=A0A4T0X2A2_9ASCO|nr:hypothetical protein CANINC_002166 [[Candida] inconspicua]
MEDKKLKKSLQLNTSFSKIRSRSISEVNSPRNESRNNDSFETDVSSRTKRKSLSINTDYKSSQKGGMLSQLSSHVKSYSFDTSLNNKGTLLSPISTVQESKEKDRLSFENTKALDNISSPIKALDTSIVKLEPTGPLEFDDFERNDDNNSDFFDDTADFWSKVRKNYPHLKITISSILLWYIFSMGISVYNRWMFSSANLNFKFPILITSFHQLILTGLAILTLILFPRFRLSNSTYHKLNEDGRITEKVSYKMPIKEYLCNILPCSIASAGDIGLGNTAFRFITLSLYTMVKTSSLIFVLLWGVLLKLEKFTLRIFAIVCIMTFGVGMMIYGQHDSNDNKTLSETPPELKLVKRILEPNTKNFVFIGVSLVLISACMSGLRWALTQIILKKNKHTKNPFLTMLYVSPGMSVFLFIVGALVEGVGEFQNAEIWNDKGFLTTIGLILIPGFLAFFMTISEFVLLQYASLLTLSIAGIFKELLTIFVSWIVFGDKLSSLNIVGLAVTFADIVWYNIYRFEQNAEAAKRNEPEENEYVDIELHSVYREE